MNALQILKKIRKYELEKEEFKLSLCHRAFVSAETKLQENQAQLEADLKTKNNPELQSLLRHLEAHFWESEQNLTQCQSHLNETILKRNEQIQQTIETKQRLDMIDRVIQHRQEAEITEQDLRDRKFLDDITQTRYAMGITS